MTENRENTAALDRMLEQMARETPEMPADFHARWTEAIRAEAGEAPRTETGKHREGRRQLRYILSAAAVFIFLIGGTLLTRSMNQTDLVNKPAAVTAAPAEKTDAAVPAMEEANDYAAMNALVNVILFGASMIFVIRYFFDEKSDKPVVSRAREIFNQQRSRIWK